MTTTTTEEEEKDYEVVTLVPGDGPFDLDPPQSDHQDEEHQHQKEQEDERGIDDDLRDRVAEARGALTELEEARRGEADCLSDAFRDLSSLAGEVDTLVRATESLRRRRREEDEGGDSRDFTKAKKASALAVFDAGTQTEDPVSRPLLSSQTQTSPSLHLDPPPQDEDEDEDEDEVLASTVIKVLAQTFFDRCVTHAARKAMDEPGPSPAPAARKKKNRRVTFAEGLTAEDDGGGGGSGARAEAEDLFQVLSSYFFQRFVSQAKGHFLAMPRKVREPGRAAPPEGRGGESKREDLERELAWTMRALNQRMAFLEARGQAPPQEPTN